MKTLFYCVALAAITAACKPKPIDENTAKSEIATQLDKYRDAMNNKDANALQMLLAEDGLFCGTDPNELFDKKTFMDMSKQSFKDTSANWKYTITKREIRVAEDGYSAIALDQVIVPGVFPKLMMRFVFYVKKIGDTWKFDFTSASFIPRNEDIEKLNKVLE